jgi:hypothetical protein
VTGFDIFAWNDPPTVSRYLAVGANRLMEMRVEGVGHNLLNVLLLPGVPVAFVGLALLPWFGGSRALRPVVLLSLITFTVTGLLFPVATTWGTFLHAAGPTHVLLVIVTLLALDALIARVARMRGWTRPVAWLGAALTIFGSALFTTALMPSFGGQSRATADGYVVLAERMEAVGLTLGAHGPVIANFPIWVADATGASTLALPNEPPSDVLDLAAAFPGTETIVIEGNHGIWPDILAAGAPGSECFDEIDLGAPADPRLAGLLAETRVFRIVCP